MKIEDVVIGQEVICDDGIGRVKAVDKFYGLIQIDTDFNNKSSYWDFDDVKFV